MLASSARYPRRGAGRRGAAVAGALLLLAAVSAIVTAEAMNQQHAATPGRHLDTYQLDFEGAPGYVERGSEPALGGGSHASGFARGGPASGDEPAIGAHVQVPILLYHYVRVNPEPRGGQGWDLSVAPDEFVRQMAYLEQAGAHTVTMSDVLRSLGGGAPLPPHPVVLTFDDGYADFATTAAPVLARDGLVATDYVVSGFVGRQNYMTADQVRQVAAMGMVIGCHTVHHVDLAKIPLTLASSEITTSKASLERLLGHTVTDFAYPYGGYDADVVALVAAAGFHDAVTTVDGTQQYLSQRFQLRRTRIGAGDTVASLARKALLPPPPPGLDAPSITSPSTGAGSPSGSSSSAHPSSPSPTPTPASPVASPVARRPI